MSVSDLDAWLRRQILRVHEAAHVEVPTPHGPTTVAWAPGHAPVVLDELSEAIWAHLGHHPTEVSDIVEDLGGAGLPPDLDPRRVAVTILDRLEVAGLVTSKPGPTPPLEPGARQTFPGTSRGGRRWVLAQPNHPRPYDRTDPRPAAGSGTDPLTSTTCDIGPGWAVVQAHSHEAGVPRWFETRQLTANGSHIATTLGLERLLALGSESTVADQAEAVADLAATSRSGDFDAVLRALAGASAILSEAPSIAAQLRPDPAAVDDLIEHDLAWARDLLERARPHRVQQSIKIRPRRLVFGRHIVWGRTSDTSTPEEIASSLAPAGLDPRLAAHLGEALAGGSRFAVGNDHDGAPGRKIYVDQPTEAWLTDLLAMPAGAGSPVDDRGHSSPPPDPAASAPPGYVAIKWTEAGHRVAIYRSIQEVHMDSATPGPPEWTRAISLFPISPEPDAHLSLTESTGRRSVDLALGGGETWGAALEPQLRELGRAASLSAAQLDELITSIAGHQVERLIYGNDGRGEPLATLYLGP